MGTALAALLALVACGVVGADSPGSGAPATQSPTRTSKQFPALADFSAVRVDGPLVVQLRPAEVPSVDVTTSGLDPSSVAVSSEGGTLRLGIVPGVDWADIGEVTAVVYVRNLRSLELDGSARARTGANLRLQGLILNLTGGSSFNGVADVAGAVLGELEGASRLVLDGAAGSFEVTLAGGSTADTDGLRAGDVRVTAGGASDALVQVNGALGVRATGGSTVRYLGQPTFIVDDVDGTSQLLAVQ